MSMHSFVKDVSLYSAINIVRYLFFTGTTYFIFWKKLSPQIEQFKIPNRIKKLSTVSIWFEIKYSIMTMIMVGLVLSLITVLTKHHVTKIYTDIHQHGWFYFFISIVITIFVHDAYFYFVHRLLHHPKIYKRAHAIHHQSMSPTPFAAYSFHPIEAFITTSFLILITLILPLHPNALIIFGLVWTIVNINGHLGYDFFNQKKWINSSTAHHLHHQWINGNYGLYFTFWDRLFKTYKCD